MRTSTGQLDWLLVEFSRDVPGVLNAIVVSGDGLRLAVSPGVDVVLADQLSAAASGLVSLATGTARLLEAGAVNQTILEMETGYLFVTAVSRGATLAVHATKTCDIGMIGYEMTMLAARVGHVLTPAPRNPVGG
ncbi:roadblock/LC7 domain-containing protein [Pseudonocardia sp. WMMC193]|uniref:roadblock/LC7 domain-containing protein n=1 Tax=Pseudonocardia sp. WMMC193 TaxID=2911965 RepID=UPI001F3DCF27|nr:roadblock/LC7 domain-containing protein [Pseudonocardia sp. WMMC193]MCF7553268.1 roadblock/LC7 domain-containing protein [Pseudonocardia sp. WMMC193]